MDGESPPLRVREDPMMPIRSAPQQAPSLGLESLMSGYQQADEKAATALIEKVSPLLLRYFLVQPACRRFAEDLLQETWIRVHRARPPIAAVSRSCLGSSRLRAIPAWITSAECDAWSSARRRSMNCRIPLPPARIFPQMFLTRCSPGCPPASAKSSSCSKSRA